MRLRDSVLTDRLLRKIPKAELHIHIEGSLEPEMMFEMAARNGVIFLDTGGPREGGDGPLLPTRGSAQENHSISSQVWPTRSRPKLWCGSSWTSRKPIPS
jgi:hypothetical protein